MDEAVNNMVSAIRAAAQPRALDTLDKLLSYHPVNIGDGAGQPGIWLAEALAVPGKPYTPCWSTCAPAAQQGRLLGGVACATAARCKT